MPKRNDTPDIESANIPKNTGFDSEKPVDLPRRRSLPQEESSEKVSESTAILFTEPELRKVDYKILEAILSAYGVDPKASDGKNTTAKLIRLILSAQTDAAAKGSLPPGLSKFKDPSSEGNNVSVLKEDGNRGNVTYNIGITKKLADYESLKISIGVTLPLDYTQEDFNKAKSTMQVTKELCLSKVEEDLLEILPKLKR